MSVRRLVVLLHGVGSNGADLAPLGEMWRAALPDVAFESPDAPYRFDHGPGFQWFSISEVTQVNRAARVAAAREGFDRTLRALAVKHGLSEHLDRVALVGFSQGSIMALDALVDGRWPVGAVVAFSGRLATPGEKPPRASATPVLLIHGEADPVIPAADTVHAAGVLERLGYDVTARIEPGVGHTITREGAAEAGQFLARAWAARAPET
jgi:phospholipase/carboxylesterase